MEPDNPSVAPPLYEVNMLAWALAYARRGWHVFPCHTPVFDADGHCSGCTCEEYRRSEECKRNYPKLYLGADGKCDNPGKCPRLKWRDKSTNDETQIRRWWGRWPSANIGMDTGKSGLIVLDADTYKDEYAGTGVELDEETVTTITGRNGTHLWYLQPEGQHYGNEKGTLPPGVDIRGEGGYVVVAPSLHSSGNRYTFAEGYCPKDAKVAPLPRSLLAILEAAQHKTTAASVHFGDAPGPAPDLAQWHLGAETIERIHHPAPKGSRSEIDQSVMTALCYASATDDEIKAVFDHFPIGLEGKYAERGVDYLARSLARARRYVAEHPRPAPPPEIDAESLAEYERYVCSPDLIEELHEAGCRTPAKARKLLDVIVQLCRERRRQRIYPGYAYLAAYSTISKQRIGAYLAWLHTAHLVELYPGEEGAAMGIELVLRKWDTPPTGRSNGRGVPLTQNWILYREHRDDEMFVNGHAVYNATHPLATLKPLGDNGLDALIPLLDGPITIKELGEETGHSYGAMARVLRRYAEHGMVNITVGERNRKTYKLKPEWREILQANRPQTTTYGVMVFRRVKAIDSRIKFLINEGKPEKADTLRPELARMKQLADRIREEAGIVPLAPRPKKPPQSKQTQAQTLRERSRPMDATEAGALGARYRRKEYAQSKEAATAEWLEFNAWATLEYGQGWWTRVDETTALGRFKVYEVASDHVPTMRYEVAA